MSKTNTVSIIRDFNITVILNTDLDLQQYVNAQNRKEAKLMSTGKHDVTVS